MKFVINFTPNAFEHLRDYKKSEQRIIVSAIKKQLINEPLIKTKNRKPLRATPISRWELRIEKFRVFYSVDSLNNVVEINAIGYKEHNKLFVGGKEFKL